MNHIFRTFGRKTFHMPILRNPENVQTDSQETDFCAESRPKLDHSMTFGIANVIRSNLKDATLEVRVP